MDFINLIIEWKRSVRFKEVQEAAKKAGFNLLLTLESVNDERNN